MRLCLAQTGDLDFIAALSKARIEGSLLTKETLTGYLSDSNLQVWVEKDDSDVKVGYLILRLEGPEAEIDELAIHQDQEGKGYGRYLLSAIETSLKEKGVCRLFLEARAKNVRANRLYQQAGYHCYRSRLNYYHDDTARCYQKEL
ncbi:MAG: GNAT family N-acetyltransferase [Bacilli bacterium]|jgi:ribosomal-protein-alanine N-acetyltransferase|nr:GNAT family N-acetyltransferase [Bacilli bacterium]